MPVRVIHIITGLPTAGAQMALYRLLANIDHEKFESVVISLMDRGPIGEMIDQLGIPVYSLNMKRGMPGIKIISNFRQLLRNLPAPDVIQGWEYHGNIAASVASWLAQGTPSVCWNIRHTPSSLKNEKKLTSIIIKFGKIFSRWVDVIIYNADASRIAHEKWGYQHSIGIVLCNGFDTAKFSPSKDTKISVRRDLGVDVDAPLVALFARFHPMKDHATFCRAAGLLLQKYPRISFVLAGEEISNNNLYLQDLLVKYGLKEHVSLLGERYDIHKLLAAVDILTLTSAWGEGFPNIIGEAMSCGVPCVVTDVGDSAKIVGSTGIVVSPGDFLAISDGVDKILSLKPEQLLELRNATRRRIEKEYTLKEMVRSYERLYFGIYKSRLEG